MLDTKLKILWDDLRGSLWFRPVLWVLAFSALAFVLISVDRNLETWQLEQLKPLLFSGGVDGTRTMLGAISTATLTVASLAFSIMMLAVVQAANAYSPRLLRNYLADTSNQHVFGILIGTFIYSLLVLRVVQGGGESNFVPTISVAAAIGLSLFSIFALIYFINHVAHSIEVASIVKSLQKEAEHLLIELFPESVGEGWNQIEPIIPPGPSAVIESQHSGYIETVSTGALLSIAQEGRAVLRLERSIGDYVLKGTPLLTVWPPDACDGALGAACQNAITLGKERTFVQDLAYAVRQLADIALRAVSPGINDPTTAINCMDVLGDILAQLAQRPLVSPFRTDEEGNLRVIAYGPTFETMLDLAFNQMRYYCRSDLHCNLRLIEILADLAHIVRRPAELAAVSKHLSMVARSADQNISEPLDRELINERLKMAAALLGRAPDSLLLDVVRQAASLDDLSLEPMLAPAQRR